MEMGSIGPSAVQRELEIALSTAYRDLAHLEEEGLLVSDEQGKRSLTDTGVSYLDSLFAG
jgi:DNA-binding IclR family transcriptional regulator